MLPTFLCIPLVRFIDINSSEYPSRLRDLENPPPLLYYRGEWNSELFSENISIAGSRRMTRYGEYMTEEIVGILVESGITPVAGLMKGIDLHTHSASILRKGRSIAVSAGGVDREDAVKPVIDGGGLVISPYSDGTQPALGCFHRRNGIIAALSPVLLVVEAGEKSGALKLAQASRLLGRSVFAVPGPLTNSRSLGTARLIQKGASILTDVTDLLPLYGIKNTRSPAIPRWVGLGNLQREILSLIDLEPHSIDELTRSLRRPVRETGVELTRLCMAGRLDCIKGKYCKGKTYAD